MGKGSLIRSYCEAILVLACFFFHPLIAQGAAEQQVQSYSDRLNRPDLIEIENRVYLDVRSGQDWFVGRIERIERSTNFLLMHLMGFDAAYDRWVSLEDATSVRFLRGIQGFVRRISGLRPEQRQTAEVRSLLNALRFNLEIEVALAESMQPANAVSAVPAPAQPPEEEAAQEVQRNRLECSICCEREISNAFPCGHMACAECAGVLRGSRCPYCRRTLADSIRIYFPH